MAEQEIYKAGDVQITTSKVVIGGNTYFLRNIASIRVLALPNLLTLGLTFFGAIMVLAGLNDLKTAWFALLLGGGLIYLAFKIGFKVFWLNFDTNAGAVRAYKGKNALLQQLKLKIEEAMAARE